MHSPEIDWRERLGDEMEEMRGHFKRMAKKKELTADDRAELINFGKAQYLPIEVMAGLYQEFLAQLDGKNRVRMRQHLIGFYSIGPLPSAQRASDRLMLGAREYDPLRLMLGIPTSAESGTL